MLQNIQAVVFDLDNTLVTSSLNFAQIRAEIGCEKGQDVLEFIAQLPKQEQRIANQRVLAHELADARSSELLPGCLALLSSIKKRQLNTAIITRNCQQAAQIKLTNSQIDVPFVLTREHFAAKPAPDALLHLAQLWQLAPEHILYVGDYIYDLQFAANANALSCLVNFGQTLDFAHLADLEVANLTELQQLLEQGYDNAEK